MSPGELIVLAILSWLFASSLVIAARRMFTIVWICAGLLILVMLSLPTSVLVNIFPAQLSQPFGSSMALAFFLILSMAVFISALLLQSGLKFTQERHNTGAVEAVDSQTQRKYAGWTAVGALTLGALLLAKAFHNLYWLMVWDITYDPLKYMWLVFPFMAVLFSAFMLVITLPGRMKLAGVLYVQLISTIAQSVDFRQLTEERAERTSRVLETYYAREGRYPQDLRQLPPWTSLSLPGPFIIYGQDWCYDGGDEYYRLGYVYREHWSDPRFVGRIYETKGKMPDQDRICNEEIAALQKRYPWMIHRDDNED